MRSSILLCCLFSCFLCSGCYREKMPPDFNFSFRVDYAEQLSTFDSTYSRLYKMHDTTIMVVFSPDEMQRMFDLMNDNNVLAMPDSFTVAQNNMNMKIPSETYYLSVKMNGILKNIKYDDCCEPKIEQEQATKFLIIADSLTNFISTKAEIRELPPCDFFLM